MTKLILAPQQKQQLNLHLVQQMKLLQLGALELEQYVREAVEANPLLEFPGEAEGPAWQETAQEVYRRKRTRDQEDEPLPDPVANAGRQERLCSRWWKSSWAVCGFPGWIGAWPVIWPGPWTAGAGGRKVWKKRPGPLG